MLSGLIEGKTYYVAEIWSSTEFTISDVQGGGPIVLTNDTGTMDLNATPFVVVPVINVNNNITPPIAQTVATATSSTGNIISVLSTANFVVGQTVDFKTSTTMFGGLVAGQIYFVESVIDAVTFTIMDQDGVQVPLSNGTGTLVTTVGGTPTVTVTSATALGFILNTRVRLDGISGSTQLNGNAYYVRPVTDTVFELYLQPYQTGLNDVNYPVTTVSTYTGGGYIWQQGILYLTSAYAKSTTASTGRILVESTENLVENTPIYFSAAGEENGTNIMGGLIQGTKYFVHTVYNLTEFSVTDEQYGDVFTLTNDSGFINCTQWDQTNVNRVWATVNGYRVPSSKLRLSDFNELSILSTINPGDEIIITNMIPTATPNEEIYINFVNSINEGTVYRENVRNRTWLTQPIYDLSTTIYVNDVTSVTDQVIQNVNTPTAIDGNYTVGLTAPRNLILGVNIVNNTTGNTIDSANYSIVIEDLAPLVKIAAGPYINVGDSLTITTLVGGTIFVHGEQINFGSVDLVNNTLGNIQRGSNGTAKQFLIPQYSVVYSLLNENRLRNTYYDQVWNSYVYNTTLGDPLQISITPPALFLQSDAI
jgi:hypothetical protein